MEELHMKSLKSDKSYIGNARVLPKVENRKDSKKALIAIGIVLLFMASSFLLIQDNSMKEDELQNISNNRASARIAIYAEQAYDMDSYSIEQ